VVSPRPGMSRPKAVLVRGRAAGGFSGAGIREQDHLRPGGAWSCGGGPGARGVFARRQGAGLVWWFLASPSGCWVCSVAGVRLVARS
jgi:hypothetical protein